MIPSALRKIVFGVTMFASTIAFATDVASTASPDGFNPDQARAQLMQLYAKRSPTRLHIEGRAKPGSQQEKFLSHFRQEIWPMYEKLTELYEKRGALQVMVDAGLALNPEATLKEIHALSETVNALSNSEAWKQAQLKWGELAKDLPGALAESARRAARYVELGTFPPELVKKLTEIERLQTDLEHLARNLPSQKNFLDSRSKISQLEIDFYSGKLSYADAASQMEALSRGGSLQFGRDVAEKGRDLLNQMARLRTELAQSKGFRTWAEYVLTLQSEGYSATYQGLEGTKKFLNVILSETDAVAKEIWNQQALKITGRPFKDLTPFGLTLLIEPTTSEVHDYFPRERIMDILRETLLSSGYAKEVVNNIIVDAFPRDGKSSHAYQAALRQVEPRVYTVDAQTLEVRARSGKSEITQNLRALWENKILGNQEPEWLKPFIYILQNFADDGVDPMSTGFHEYGHAMDYSHRRTLVGISPAYGYVETHSMTLEHFTRDREFLLHYGRTRDGARLSAEIVDKYLKNLAMDNLVSIRGGVRNALFDLELWNVDYTLPGSDFVETALKVFDQLRERTNFYPPPAGFERLLGYNNFVTSHFFSGEVRYYGYIHADVSSTLVIKHTLDELQARTGRRSFFRQPSLGPMLAEGLYRHGTALPFPDNIERYIGSSYSPVDYARELVRRYQETTHGAGSDCKDFLIQPIGAAKR